MYTTTATTASTVTRHTVIQSTMNDDDDAAAADDGVIAADGVGAADLLIDGDDPSSISMIGNDATWIVSMAVHIASKSIIHSTS
jgi:hypothetical protein